MTLSNIFEQMDSDTTKFFDGVLKDFRTEYKGWQIIKGGRQGYGYEVRNPQGYLSLETSKDGTLKECKQYIDTAMSSKALRK